MVDNYKLKFSPKFLKLRLVIALIQLKQGFIKEAPRPDSLSVKTQFPRGNQRFQPLPPATGSAPYHLRLEDVLRSDELDQIQTEKTMAFHCVGDTGGVRDPVPQQLVANALESIKANFFYHLGDVVYYNGQSEEYYPQFYEPYQHYQHPIFAIPGNHDGDPLRGSNEKSLKAFVKNFCARSMNISPDAGQINRSPMIQPNVYWTLNTPYAIIIGLYTNVPEGGVVKQNQINWLENELRSAHKDNNNHKKAIIVSLHHPIFSMDRYHSGSQSMLNLLDNAFENTEVIPDAVFAAHVHNYQRFTRTYKNRKLPYIVAGAGGYWNLHWMQKSVYQMSLPEKLPDRDDVILEKYIDNHHGFMHVQVTPNKLIGKYYTVPNPHESWHASLTPTEADNFEFPIE